MKLVRFRTEQGSRLGVVTGGEVVDLVAVDSSGPADMASLLNAGTEALVRAARRAEDAPAAARLTLERLTLDFPVAAPGKIVCLGLNYLNHVNEGPFTRQRHPTLFMRALSSLVPHGQPLVRPLCSATLDYEAELVAVIGRRVRNAGPDEAVAAVAGYSCFNDGSVREYQRHTPQWTMGKNFDRSGAFGPVLVTADALPAGAKGLSIACRVNGEVMQTDNTANMMFPVADTIAYISQGMTLDAGDLVVMGTPAGVGHARTPQRWLRAGDVVEVEIEGIGTLRNPVVDEERRQAAE